MATGDWFYDRFETTIKEGAYDLSRDQTSVFEEYDLADDTALDIETRFIDELWNTDDRRTVIPGEDYQALDNDRWRNTYYDDRGALALGDVGTTWGLDLWRKGMDDFGPDGQWGYDSIEFYNHITKGPVDWARYENDPQYIAAFESMQEDKDTMMSGYADLSFLTDNSFSEQKKVDFIAAAKEAMGNKDDTEWKHTDWKANYSGQEIKSVGGDLYIDGERQETIQDRLSSGNAHLDVSFSTDKYSVGPTGEVSASAWDPWTPAESVDRPSIAGISWESGAPKLINPEKVEVATNIPESWHGAVRSTLTIGGHPTSTANSGGEA